VDIIQEVEKKYRKKEISEFRVGDTVSVEVSISEGGKERVQLFTGVVIAIKGKGINRTFTVRRIVQGEGVERTFPFHSPKIGDVTIKKAGVVRRAKLYYLRERKGKGARIKEMTGARLAKKKKQDQERRESRRLAHEAEEKALSDAAAGSEAKAEESQEGAPVSGKS